MIAKERELLRFHSELVLKENELQVWKEELQSKSKDLDDRERKIKLLEKGSVQVDTNILGSNGVSLSPSHLRKIIQTKSYSFLNLKSTQ